MCPRAQRLGPALRSFVLEWEVVWWGQCCVFGVKEGCPATLHCLFTLFSGPACWVKRERAREAQHTHTHTVHSVSSVLLSNRKHCWLHKGPLHQSSYRMWQPLQQPLTATFHFVPPWPEILTSALSANRFSAFVFVAQKKSKLCIANTITSLF